MIFIWEGAVATLPDGDVIQRIEKVALTTKRWDRAVNYWNVNEHALKWMWAILARTDFRIDVCVTTRPSGFARAVARRSEQENWPVRYVFAEPADLLGRRLSSMADVERVVYGLEEQRWAYGPHGLFLSRDSGQIV
jgi:hypothetical protein